MDFQPKSLGHGYLSRLSLSDSHRKHLKFTCIAVASILSLLPFDGVMAEYASGITINRYYVRDDGKAFFGTSPKPINTCSYWGEYFFFDSTTLAGKNLLATLISAKLAGKKLDVWYAPPADTYIGTDQASGCNVATMARLQSIGIL